LTATEAADVVVASSQILQFLQRNVL